MLRAVARYVEREALDRDVNTNNCESLCISNMHVRMYEDSYFGRGRGAAVVVASGSAQIKGVAFRNIEFVKSRSAET